jgi:uncharacterized OB-fold protein
MDQVQPMGAQAHYEAALAQGRLEIQHCTSCNAHVFYPRQVCPHCASTALQWVQPSGLGTVYASTTVCVNPKNTYDVTLIDLDEGVRMMSRVSNRPAGGVPIGLRVKARVDQADGRARLVFDAVEVAV